MENIKIFGREIIDDSCMTQLANCISSPEDRAALMADAHYGYGHPIGGVVAYKDKISLSGVGFDIGCGNYAVKTEMKAGDLNISKVMDQIFDEISFGVGRKNPQPIEHTVLDQIREADFSPQRRMLDMAAKQLGTVGGGNHFVDVFKDDEGYVWIGVHFGSRGFGHRTTTGFIALSKGFDFGERVREGGMDQPPILFDLDSDVGQSYINAMQLAGAYAYAGREIVVQKVLEILDNPLVTFEVHNHHNYAWHEEHFGERYWVVRKGSTPAFPGQQGFIGATMADTSVIIEGVDSPDSREGLYSTIHGAGRVMSRTQAAGKRRWTRDKKTGRRIQKSISRGLVDFQEVKQRMKTKNIELRGAGADEAPQCYKKLEEVLQYHTDTIKVINHLHPIGVAMAPAEVADPYKD